MLHQKNRSSSGQALVEFALIIGILLLFIFIIIEAGRAFQAWQTVQNAAREAGRYAITGQYDPECVLITPLCNEPYNPRVYSIEQKALASASGLVINPTAEYGDPHYFETFVRGVNEEGQWLPQYPGASRQAVYIRVTYRMPIITPILSSIVQTLRVVGAVTVINEDFDQFGNTMTNPSGPPPGDGPGPPQELFADLLLIKKSVPEPPAVVVVDTEFEYDLKVYNVGDRFATGVLLTDTLPGELTFVTASAGCIHAGGGIVTCDLGIIPPNPDLLPDPSLRRDVTIRVRAPDNVPYSPYHVTNPAVVTGNEFDIDPGNNFDSAVTRIISHGSDLDVFDMVSEPLPVTVGENFTLHISFRNNGPNATPATEVMVTTALDPTLQYVSGTTSKGTTCTFDTTSRTVSCLMNSLDYLEAAQASITVTSSEVGTVEHVASISATQYDPDNTNNTRTSFTTIVPPQADMRITKSSSPSSVMPNQDVSYLIQVVNQGPSTATDIVVTDTLPENTIFVSSSPQCGPPVGRVVTCNIALLPPNLGQNVVNLIIVARPLQIGTIINEVTVTASQEDINLNNNWASATTQVVAADLQIVKGPKNNPQVPEGSTFDFTLTVTNHGPSPATGIVVADTLPASFQYVVAIPSQGICSHGGGSPGGTVICNVGGLAVNATAIITLRVIPTIGSPGQGTVFTNTATVNGSQGDPVPANNTDSASIRVVKTNNPFLTLAPTCNDPGRTVVVNGYNFKTGGSHSLTITLDPGGAYETILYYSENFSQENWQRTVTLPNNLELDRDYVIQAIRQSDMPTVLLTVPCPKPDLVIGNLQLLSPLPLTSYEPVMFSAVITNVGQVDAVTQFFVSLYIDPPAPVPDATHIPAAYRATIFGVSGLQVNQTRVVTLTAAAGFPGVGDFSLYAVADSDPGPTGIIGERHETNNIAGPLVVTVTEEGEAPEPPPGPGDESGSLVGITWVPQPGLGDVQQPYTPVQVYNASGILIAQTESNRNGIYFFDNLPVGIHTVVACITLDGLQYFASVPGINILEDQLQEQDIYLERTACF